MVAPDNSGAIDNLLDIVYKCIRTNRYLCLVPTPTTLQRKNIMTRKSLQEITTACVDIATEAFEPTHKAISREGANEGIARLAAILLTAALQNRDLRDAVLEPTQE